LIRVLLVGSAPARAAMRSRLNGDAIAIVGEFASLAAAQTADLESDGILVAGDGRGERSGVLEPLTPREIEVLELLAEGLPNKAIAARLHISDQTVKFHIAAIAGKLGASNRTDIVRRAVRGGLITL
jgi:DNA-binding NarL/FixJ family response regulator